MSTVIKSPITRFLERVPAQVLAVYAIVAAFSTYFCMYAFRRPFAAANYEGLRFFGTDIDLKTAFVISQILGYMLSKYIGIKVCSETTRKQRMWRLFGLIIAAEVALVLFAVLPAEWKLIAIFCNGLPLGMVWGLVVLYLEGRRTSELLLAGLSCSFIIASGVVKGAGRWLIEAHGYGDFTMPAMTGLIFLVPFVISVFLLNQIPEPTQKDIDARVQRESMNASERMRFMKEFLPGMLMLLTAYFFLTAYRDFRDNYMSNILLEMGITEQTKFMLLSELPVAFGVLVMLGGLFLIRNNRWGLIGAYAIMLLGLVLMGGSTLLLDNGAIRGDVWMVLVGLGAYLAYVPFGSVLFDRLIAATRVIGTAVFAIYVADAIGYMGSVGVQLYKDIVETDATRLDFFRRFTYGMSILGVVLMASSCVYFLGKAKKSLSADR